MKHTHSHTRIQNQAHRSRRNKKRIIISILKSVHIRIYTWWWDGQLIDTKYFRCINATVSIDNPITESKHTSVRKKSQIYKRKQQLQEREKTRRRKKILVHIIGDTRDGKFQNKMKKREEKQQQMRCVRKKANFDKKNIGVIICTVRTTLDWSEISWQQIQIILGNSDSITSVNCYSIFVGFSFILLLLLLCFPSVFVYARTSLCVCLFICTKAIQFRWHYSWFYYFSYFLFAFIVCTESYK